MATPAPASARQRVIALPMPRPPPVTMATLPFRLMDALMMLPVGSHLRFAASRRNWLVRPRLRRLHRRRGHFRHLFVESGETLVLREPLHVANVDLLDDHRDFEQA